MGHGRRLTRPQERFFFSTELSVEFKHQLLLAEEMTPGVQEFEGVAVIGSKHITMRQHFVNGAQCHAKIEVVEGAVAKNPVLPALGIGDFLYVRRRAGVKRYSPGVA